MAYQQMASVYDRLMDDAPYDSWTEFTNQIIMQSGKEVKSIVDLGCGTGRITTRLARYGYEMTGVDFSSDMLSHAEQRASDENVSIRWINQDLRELQGIKEQDVAVSYCDVINYVTEEAELRSVFRNVADTLKEGGLFLFDVHSLHHVNANFVGQTFAEAADDTAYIWECTAGENEGEMHHDLTFFVQDNNIYRRFEEYHHQRTFSIEFYKQLLESTGFELIHLSGDFSVVDGDVHDETERIFIGAKKRLEK